MKYRLTKDKLDFVFRVAISSSIISRLRTSMQIYISENTIKKVKPWKKIV